MKTSYIELIEEIQGGSLYSDPETKWILDDIFKNKILKIVRRFSLEKELKNEKESPSSELPPESARGWHSSALFQRVFNIFNKKYEKTYGYELVDLLFKDKKEKIIFIEIGMTRLTKLLHYPMSDDFKKFYIVTFNEKIYEILRGKNFTNAKIIEKVFIRYLKRTYYEVTINTILSSAFLSYLYYNEVIYNGKDEDEMAFKYADIIFKKYTALHLPEKRV